MDPLFIALSLYRRRKYKKCEEKCNELLAKAPSDQSVWLLKMKSMTAQVYIDQLDIDEGGLADMASETPSMAVSTKPGTSFAKNNEAGNTSFGLRNQMKTGRMVTGYLRPDTHARGGTGMGLGNALKTASKPMSRAVTRAARLATASLMFNPDESFINLSRIDLSKYALKHTISKHLFEYIFYRENDIKKAFELATLASKANEGDWWWGLQVAKCFNRQRKYRDAIEQLHSSIKNQPFLETYLYLSKVFVKLDQPQSSITTLTRALCHFPSSVSLLLTKARLFELLGEQEKSMEMYEGVLVEDFMNVEAIACVGTSHFYDEKPESATKYFQRLLQMGVANAETYNNLGLCCFQSQQFDLCMTCFRNGLDLSSDDLVTSDIWYNIGHVSLAIGDLNMASQSYQISLAYNDKHAESYNNMAVMEFHKGKLEMARAFLQSSFNSDDSIFEPHFNYAILSEKLGVVESTYNSLRKSLDINPDHQETINLFKSLSQLLNFD